jgi:acetyltransferase
MRRIIAYARGRGIGEIFGEVLGQNTPMLTLCKTLGFRLETNPRDASVVTVRLALAAPGSERGGK